MQAAPNMQAAQKALNIAPLEEKVQAVEKKVQESQYALKFVGAAVSSAQRPSRPARRTVLTTIRQT